MRARQLVFLVSVVVSAPTRTIAPPGSSKHGYPQHAQLRTSVAASKAATAATPAAKGMPPNRIYRDLVSDAVVFGPGLTRWGFGVRRWFVIQAVGGGVNLTRSPLLMHSGIDKMPMFGAPKLAVPFTVEITSVAYSFGNRSSTIQNDVYDRGDGTYFVTYTAAREYDELLIIVKLGDKSGKVIHKTRVVGPHGEKGYIHGEGCDCPEPNGWQWQREQAKCSVAKDEVMAKRMVKVKAVTREMINAMLDAPDKKTLIHYVIKENQVYYRVLGNMADFRAFPNAILLSLVRKVKLPDLEFVFNVGDWPKSTLLRQKDKTDRLVKLPFMSWCGTPDTTDVVLPTWTQINNLAGTAVEDHQRMDGLAFAAGGGWENKKPVLFFRGRDSCERRVEIADKVQTLMETRHDVDIRIHEWSWRHRGKPIATKLGTAKRTPMYQFWENKYLLSIDGTVAAYRLAALLAGDSVVFKQNSSYYEHYYQELQPWVHYIPLNEDLSDWDDKLQWAKKHDLECQTMVKNARAFIRDRMKPSDIYCGYYATLTEYASRQDFKPVVGKNMTLLSREKALEGPLMRGAMPGPATSKECSCSVK